MPNGRPGDHPLTDLFVHKREVYGRETDDLLRKICPLCASQELDVWWEREIAKLADRQVILRKAQSRYDELAEAFMRVAIGEAELGLAEGGIPIGSVLVNGGQVIGRGHNQRVQRGGVVLHGEMDALENAGRQPARVYRESTLFTTLSPCAMCSGAILLYGLPRVVVGENRTFMGEEALLRERGVTVDVVQDRRCQQLMERFIAAHPQLWAEDIGE